MGKKIKSGAGDLVCASALPLDQQIERSNVESQRDTPRVKQRNLKRAKPDDEVCKKEVFCIIGKEFKKNIRWHKFRSGLMNFLCFCSAFQCPVFSIIKF